MSSPESKILREVLIPLKSSPNSDRTILLVREVEDLVNAIIGHTGKTREDFMVSGAHYRILLYIFADHFLVNGNVGISKKEILRRSGYKAMPILLPGIFNIRRVNGDYHVLGWEKKD